MGWIFLTALNANMDGALCDAAPVHNVQRCLEELEQYRLALEQEPHGPEDPSIFNSEMVNDGDDEQYDCGSLLVRKACCAAK